MPKSLNISDCNTILSISIIIPVFNDQSGLNKCLQEISLQSYPTDSIEVIVVDNGSAIPIVLADINTLKITLTQCATLGSYAARNTGVKIATGDVFCFIDADCWPDENWLRSALNTLREHKGNGIVGGEVKIIKPENPTSVALYQHITGFDQENNIAHKGFSATANIICFRSQFERVGFYSETLLSGGDREWCWRAIANGLSIIYEPKSIVYTEPRTTLRSAIIQARRVTAGRKMLHCLNMTHVSEKNLAKKRTPWQAITWILSRKELSIWERLRIVCVASIIRTAEMLETIKLTLGSKAERR